jgi:DNA-binding NtrC family response regulator
MIQVILAEDGVRAMQLGGILLDQENLNVEVVSDGKSLLDQLNEAPNFFHAVVMNFDLPEISGPECLTFIKQFHQRVCVLVMADSVGAERLEELAGLGVRKKYVMDRGGEMKEIGAWIDFTLGEEGLEGQGGSQ